MPPPCSGIQSVGPHCEPACFAMAMAFSTCVSRLQNKAAGISCSRPVRFSVSSNHFALWCIPILGSPDSCLAMACRQMMLRVCGVGDFAGVSDPANEESSAHVHRHHSRWAQKGVWERVFKALSTDPNNEYAMIDATIVRAHQHAAGGKKADPEAECIGRSKGGPTTKIHAACDALGNPRPFISRRARRTTSTAPTPFCPACWRRWRR